MKVLEQLSIAEHTEVMEIHGSLQEALQAASILADAYVDPESERTVCVDVHAHGEVWVVELRWSEFDG